MKTYLCMEHNLSFLTQQAYDEHKMTAHQRGVALPPNIPESALPDPEFIKQVAEIEKRKQEVEKAQPIVPQEFDEVTVATPVGNITRKLPKTNSVQVPQIQTPVAEKPVTPLALTYKYTGDCPEHKVPVETFSVTGEATYMIAYCLSGNHQVESKRVIPVKEQTFERRKK